MVANLMEIIAACWFLNSRTEHRCGFPLTKAASLGALHQIYFSTSNFAEYTCHVCKCHQNAAQLLYLPQVEPDRWYYHADREFSHSATCQLMIILTIEWQAAEQRCRTSPIKRQVMHGIDEWGEQMRFKFIPVAVFGRLFWYMLHTLGYPACDYWWSVFSFIARAVRIWEQTPQCIALKALLHPVFFLWIEVGNTVAIEIIRPKIFNSKSDV